MHNWNRCLCLKSLLLHRSHLFLEWTRWSVNVLWKLAAPIMPYVQGDATCTVCPQQWMVGVYMRAKFEAGSYIHSKIIRRVPKIRISVTWPTTCPFRGQLVVHTREGSVLCVPYLKRIALFVRKLLGGPKIRIWSISRFWGRNSKKAPLRFSGSPVDYSLQVW